MEEENKHIELYSGNWLNNAAVLGFLISLEMIEKKDPKQYLIPDGRVIFPTSIFDELKVNERYFEDGTKISSIVAKAPIYRNYLQPSEKELYSQFVQALKKAKGGQQCDILVRGYNIPEEEVLMLRSKGLDKFFDRISDFNMIFHASLGPSIGAFPNAYWNMKNSNKTCHLFAFLIIHQHLAFTKLMDNSQIFINAPSFRLMYELNKILEKLANKDHASFRNLLAMSVIEFSVKTNVMLHTWASMDIEIVAIKNNNVEFINLPYETIKLLSNKKIAEMLSSIGEFRILNMVIDNKWKDLVELGYRLLKIAMKNNIGKEDRNFINNFFYSSGSLQSPASIKQLANKLMKLYSLIEERTKNNKYGYING